MEICTNSSLTEIYRDWKRSSGWLESWEGLLLVTDVSTTCAEAIFRVKCQVVEKSGCRKVKCQVVETSVTNNSPSQDSNHPDDLFQSRYVTPGFKPFSYLLKYIRLLFILRYSPFNWNWTELCDTVREEITLKKRTKSLSLNSCVPWTIHLSQFVNERSSLRIERKKKLVKIKARSKLYKGLKIRQGNRTL